MPQVKRNLVSTIKNLFTSFLTSFYVTEDFLRKNNLKKIKKTLLENIRKISKLGGDRVKCSVLPPKEIFLTVKVKDYAKADIKVFWSCPIFYFFYFLPNTLCRIAGWCLHIVEGQQIWYSSHIIYGVLCMVKVAYFSAGNLILP